MPPKKAKSGPRGMSKPIPPGLVMTDLFKKEWKLGPVIGQGGFGYIYLGGSGGSANVTLDNADYVIKVEPHLNGPLFVELAFYMRGAKPDLINAWMKTKKLSHLGIPLFIGSGKFDHGNEKYRFMVINRFGSDVEKLCVKNGGTFPEKTVYSLGLRMVDALEYLHEHDYCHADIKASNIMMGFKKADISKMYLLDYGLAFRYRPDGNHIPYKEDPKRKHDGTIEYTSRDAHKGLAPARRGDLEILGYCMIQWLCKKLPWEDKLSDKDYVFKQKEKYMKNLKDFMSTCFLSENIPGALQDFLELVNKLEYDEKPDYDKIRKMFRAGLKKSGVTDDGKSIYLPTGSGARKSLRKSQSSATPIRGRAALNDLGAENSPKKTRTLAKSSRQTTATPRKGKTALLIKQDSENSPAKTKTPAKKEAPVSARKRKTPTKRGTTPLKESTIEPTECSPVKRIQASMGVRRSPRRQVLTSSDESDDESLSSVKKMKTMPGSQLSNASELGTSSVVIVDGVKKTVHRRPRKKNVPTRDFGQSP